MSKILFSPLEDKIHIFKPPCNILYIQYNITYTETVYFPCLCIYDVFMNALIQERRYSNDC